MFHHSWVRKLLCCWMLVALPGAMMSADRAAMLYGTGEVTVNGKPVSRASAIFAGDKIYTGKESAVTLSFGGSRVNLPADSAIIYQPNTIVMEHGRALLQAKRGTVAQLAGVRVRPAAASARFQLIQSDSKIQIAALEGSVEVSDGTNTTELPQGKEMTHQPATEKGAQGDSAGDSTGGAAGPPAPPVRGGGLPGWVIAAATAGIAGGTGGGLAAAGTFSSGRRSSPSQP